MWIYLTILLCPLALAGASQWSPHDRDKIIWGVGLFLVLFIGFRRDIGCDWDPYLGFLRFSAILSPAQALHEGDPAYMLINILAAKSGFTIGMVNVVCAILFVAGLLLFVRRQPFPHLALLLAIPVLVMIAGLSATRQSVAIGLSLWAIALMMHRRDIVPIALIVIAGLFHWTAFLLLPLTILMQWDRRIADTHVQYLVLGSATLLGISMWAFPELALLLPVYKPSGGATFRIMPNIVAVLASVLLRRHLGMTERERLIAAYLSGIAILSVVLLPYSQTAADRLAFYAVPLQMLILARLPLLASSDGFRSMAQVLVALPVLVLLAGWLMATSAKPCYQPYRTYLTDPAALRSWQPAVPRASASCIVKLEQPGTFVATAAGTTLLSDEDRKCLRILAMRFNYDRPGRPCSGFVLRPTHKKTLGRLPPNMQWHTKLFEKRQCIAALGQHVRP